MKSTFSKILRKNTDFGYAFGGQIDEKSKKNGAENNMFFLAFLGWCFFRFLVILARFWEALEGPKINKKIKNRKQYEKGRCWDAPYFKGGFREGFGKVSGGFWEGFGRIWGRHFQFFFMDLRKENNDFCKIGVFDKGTKQNALRYHF